MEQIIDRELEEIMSKKPKDSGGANGMNDNMSDDGDG